MSSPNATPIESNSSNHEKDETHVNDSESSSHLVQHSSKSSLFFYYFSFCPPFPPLGKPREVLQHPLTLYFLGIICAVLAGLAFPALDLLYGIWTNGITLDDATESEIKARSNYVAWIMTIVGFADLILCWLFLTLFTTASHRLSQSLRHAYISSTLAQDAEHFDQHGAGEIATKAGKDVNTVRVGLGEKSGYLFWSLSTLIASIVTGFVKAPKVAGFLFVLIPLTVATFAVLGWAGGKAGAPALKLEGRASSYVEQILSSVRVVQSFGMEKNLVQRYDQAMLGPLQKFGMRKATVRGLELGTVYFVLNLCYSTAFWWGSIQITHGLPNGTMLTAFWNFLNSLFSLANVVPHISGIFDAFTTLAALRRAIERQPKIDVRDQGGLKLDGSPDFRPSIEFKDVTFAYPSRPTVASLRGVSFFAEHGKVIALVGPSGGGKSSIANLVLREYDPLTSTIPNESDVKDSEAVGDLGLEETDGSQKISEKKKKGFFGKNSSGDEKVIDEKQIEEGKESERIKGGGEVLFAGQDVRNLNLTWLRSQIAVVQQNPQMFSASIFENVAAGLTGTEFEYRPDRDGLQEIDSTSSPEDFTFSLNPQDQEKEDKKALEAIERKYSPRTQEIRRKVRDALSKAQALEFVEKLPEGIDTLVSGGRTGLLSGGQRQRIAIARALIREPAVILLDEGTSALDSYTETKIKLMLEEEQKKRGMTTILIAHRLSTIQHADQILVLKKGQVVDRGTHDELFKASRADQTYRTMVNQQRAIAEPDQDDSSDEKRPLSTSSSDELEQSEKNDVLDQEATIEREAEAQELLDLNASDGNTTKVGGTTVVGNSDDVETWNKPKPTPIRRTTSRPGDHRQWQVSGRTAALGQLEHTAEASNNAEMNDNRSTHSTVSVAPSRVPTVSVPVEKSTLVKRFCGYLWRQRLYFSIGVIGALVASASFPVAGWMTGKVVSSLSIQGDNHRLRSEANKWSLYFLVLALASLVIVAIQSCFLEFGSEHISRRLKTQGLSALVRQEIGWFDSESNQAGGLTAAVSGTHPANVSAATGLVTSQILISLGNLIGSVILAFILSWQQAIVTLPPIIVLFLSGYLNIKMLSKYEDMAQVPADRAASYISENVDAIKTVQALGREHETMRVFDHRAKSDPKRTGYLIWGAGGFAISQAMVFLLCALIFFYGGKLLAEGTVDVTKLYATFEAVIIGSFGAGRIFTFVNDFGRAKSSFKSVTAWCMRQPRIASIQAPEGKVGNLRPAEDIVIADVEMRYPQRPKHPALRSLNLTIKAGSTVAFCGTSGSGKSSILALLQRFYDPSRGTIDIGGVDVRAIPLEEFRSQMAFVSQEPTLYGGGSIAWNLRLGSTDPDSVTQEEIEDACEAACILDFVRGLPEGFETDVGLKGAQLSGGQKQRLCIARALIRKPKILLLDEATSALDAESELSVQRALENASKGRTTISIAHRLSTIRNADEIHVVEDGHIIESGSHDELLRRRGRYLELIEAQL